MKIKGNKNCTITINGENVECERKAKNNSDTENNFPINFHPMPKRYMVWDKETKEFWYDFGGKNLIFESEIRLGLWLANRKEVHGLSLDRFIIVQSINLFDKDGKEIFEGSILKCKCGTRIKLVEEKNGGFFPLATGCYEGANEADEVEVIGHILSNPELLEGKNV